MKKILSVLLIVVLCVAVLTSCGAQMGQPSEGYDEDNYKVEESLDPDVEDAPEESKEDGASGSETTSISTKLNANTDPNRKIVYSSTFQIDTENFDKDMNAIADLLNKCNGYVEKEVTQGTAPQTSYADGRTSEIIVRIPTGNYTKFTDELSGVGNMVNKEFHADDISDTYYDTQSRIDMLQNRYDKLNEHLKKATKMEDIIKLEEEMSGILSEIDTLKGEKRGMDYKVTYATASITLTEVVTITEMPAQEESYSNRADKAFKGGSDALSVFLSEISLFFIAISPFLLMLVVIAAAIIIPIMLVKRNKKRKLQNKTDKQ